MNRLKGTIEVVGTVGVGKTSFGVETPISHPKKMAVFNFDVKPVPGSDDFGFYNSYAHMFLAGSQKKESALAESVYTDLKAMEDGAFEVIVFDSWALFQKSLFAYVKLHRSEIKDVWHGQGVFWTNMEMWGAANRFEAALIELAQQKAETVIVINHLTDQYDSKTNQPTGKFIPLSSKSVVQKSAARIWLIPNPNGTCPIGLVLKGHTSRTFNKKIGRMVTASILPEKITPSSSEGVSLWDSISDYIDNPAGLRALKVTEVFTPAEREMISEAVNAYTYLDDTVTNEIPGLRDFLAKNDGPDIVLAKKASAELDHEITVDQIKSHRG